MKKNVSIGTTAALCLLSATTACTVTLLASRTPIARKMNQITQIIEKEYVGEFDMQTAQDTAAAGYIVGIGDRWSSYLPKAVYETYKLSFQGKTIGIGVNTISTAEEKILVTSVHDGSPAAKAGICPKDEILGADGVTTEKDGDEATISAIKGEAGTSVRITVRHDATGETDTHEIVRDEVTKTSVRARMLEGEIGYLQISSFDGVADTQFLEALEKLRAQGAEKLIIDVRWNNGGSIDVLSKILDPLLPEGTIISLEPKHGEGAVYTSDAESLDLPMAVLINAKSISAAEFFAEALREYEKAVLVGDQTIGKGYSQRQYQLYDGSAIVLSDQMYFTPQGKNLKDIGITPDIAVSLPEELDKTYFFMTDEEDTQLQAAIAALREE